MLQRTISYTDFNGRNRVQEFYFHLNKAEIAELAYSERGGLKRYLQDIVESENAGAVLATFRKIITVSVGKKDEGGNLFMKSEEITNNFLRSNAFEELFIELVSDPEKMVQFIRGIIPADMLADVEPEDKHEYSTSELRAMTDEAFFAAVGTDESKWTREILIMAFKRRNARAA
jgi:hypothetical protein